MIKAAGIFTYYWLRFLCLTGNRQFYSIFVRCGSFWLCWIILFHLKPAPTARNCFCITLCLRSDVVFVAYLILSILSLHPNFQNVPDLNQRQTRRSLRLKNLLLKPQNLHHQPAGGLGWEIGEVLRWFPPSITLRYALSLLSYKMLKCF